MEEKDRLTGLASAAFISFRLKTMDGVSFEVEKRIEAFSKWGFDIHRVAGQIPGAVENDHVIPEISHRDPEVESFAESLFSSAGDRSELKRELDRLSINIGERLTSVLDEIGPAICVCEDIFSLPLNLPFALALCRYIEERDVPALSVYHDSGLQDALTDPCFCDSVLADVIDSYYPPSMPQIAHVVHCERGREELYKKKELIAFRWHDYHDFKSPRVVDDFNAALRSDLGIGGDETMLLQPSLVIDKSVIKTREFAEDLHIAGGGRVYIVVTGDCEEGFLDEFKKLQSSDGVELIHLPEWVGPHRDYATAQSRYDIGDLYACSDMVVYPGDGEVWGNPALESAEQRKPLLIGDDPLVDEMRCRGFQFLPLDSLAGQRAWKLLQHKQLLEEMAERNLEAGRRYYSTEKLPEEMDALLKRSVSVYRP